ncbi:MAG: tyrosine--tRNA ligase [Nanoarchaeota archaeon]
MDIEKRFKLIKEVGEEIITEAELLELLKSKKKFVAYDGFEPSGSIHVAQGIMRAVNINKMVKAGCHFKMWVADWFAWANNKLGGNLGNIQTAGDYMIEVWKACGLDMDGVEFLLTSDHVSNPEYWKIVMNVARNSTVNRIVRCGQIMGRKESEMQQASQILYPCMQCADIFYLEADVCQLGMDQRKVNVLAREIGPKLGFWKPVVVSHHMLMGLGKPVSNEKDSAERAIDLKMSKSRPETAVFMTDTKEQVERKISNAYCPASQVGENPLMEYMQYLIFEKFSKVKIERDKKFGGDVEFSNYNGLVKSYSDGEVHPLDLKKAVAFYVNKMLDPVRKHFDTNKKARDLLNQVRSFEITR